MEISIVEKIVDLCPNITLAKNFMSWVREKRLKSHYISEKEVKQGETNPNEKNRIVNKYIQKNDPYIKKTLTLSEEILSKSAKYNRESNRDRIRVDMIFCRLAYGFQPDEYLLFDLENQSSEERRQWVSDTDRYIAIYHMNNPKDMQLLNNKARTLKLFGDYYGRDAISIRTSKDYDKFETFVKEHPVFVKKQVLQSMGRSVQLVDITSVENGYKGYFQKLLQDGEHILEEKICQCNVMASLNGSSVNTVRCFTFKTRSGVIIPYAFLKIGRNGSFVDNGGAGGILVGINVKTGVLDTDGYDEDNVRYIRHPDSDVVLHGYQLPEWNKMIDLCKKLAEQIPGVQCIGWDMAHTDQGWVVVEVNGRTQFIGPQIVYKKGIKEELRQIMSDMELIG